MVDEAFDDTLFVARQPIFDRERTIVGYELLYRSSQVNEAHFDDPDLATAQVIVTTFLELGLERLVGSKPAYVNLTRAFFTGRIGLPVTPEQVVLEVLEDFALDEAVLAGIRDFADEGYRIVLDDFRYRPDYEPALGIASAVKLDLASMNAADFRTEIARARARGLQVIAERVETEAQFRECLELGCDLFQGFFLRRPRIFTGKPMPSNKAVLLTLLARIEDPDVDVDELERLIVQDVTLSYRLLRQVNCATFALRREIVSVREAIILLGARLVRHWASLILLSHLGEREQDAQPLMDIALVRARMCERLATAEACCDPKAAFTAGLFSVLDALLQRPMDELLDAVAFTEPVHLALADRSGPLGELLQRVTDYESARWAELEAAGASAPRYRDAYLEAIAWSAETRALLLERVN